MSHGQAYGFTADGVWTPLQVGAMGAIADREQLLAVGAAEQIQAALAGAIIDVVQDAAASPEFSARDHFRTVCQSVGLLRIMPPIAEV